MALIVCSFLLYILLLIVCRVRIVFNSFFAIETIEVRGVRGAQKQNAYQTATSVYSNLSA